MKTTLFALMLSITLNAQTTPQLETTPFSQTQPGTYTLRSIWNAPPVAGAPAFAIYGLVCNSQHPQTIQIGIGPGARKFFTGEAGTVTLPLLSTGYFATAEGDPLLVTLTNATETTCFITWGATGRYGMTPPPAQ